MQARPDFALTEANAPAVAAICRHLDGLPLAIELAAAWVPVLRPQDLLQRLERDGSLPAPPNAFLDLPDRQRSLRAALAWSHDHLTRAEQHVFRRLAVFASAASLSGIEAICKPDGDEDPAPPGAPVEARDRTLDCGPADVLDALVGLVGRNLVQTVTTWESDQPRFALSHTARAYAREKLIAADREEEVRQRHAAYYQSFASRLLVQMQGTDRKHALALAAEESANLQAALDWVTHHERGAATGSLRDTLDELRLENDTRQRAAAGHADKRGAAYSMDLSTRQEEVAHLIAQGLTNKQIARELIITEKTVGTHVEDIFNKLGFQARTQVAAWVATRQGAARVASQGAAA
jgi:predicted ATPase